ncbi:MAG: DUF3769 domain-containing protein [Synechococcales cyanobacterium]
MRLSSLLLCAVLWGWGLSAQAGIPTTVASAEQVAETPPTPPPSAPPEVINRLELLADEQTFDQERQVFTARGNVTLTFRQSRLLAESVQVDLTTRRLRAQGRVWIEVGEQRLQGESLDYDFGRETGEILNVHGEIRFASLENDTAPLSNSTNPRPQTLDVKAQAPVVPRLVRFRAERIRFDARTWEGENVTLTNDPVDPPELRIQAPVVNLTLDERGSGLLTAPGGQLVFDQVTFLPIPGRLRLDQFRRGFPITLRTDAGEPGRGLLLQGNFEILEQPNISFIVSPQFFLARWLNGSQGRDGLAGLLGLETQFRLRSAGGQLLSVLTQLDGLVLNELGSRFRAQVVYSIPTGDGGSLNPFYSYRQLFYNGLLGFQTVNQRLGVFYRSPTINFGDPDTQLTYQATVEWVDALGERQVNSDPDLAVANAEVLQLTKVSLEATLDRRFPLWLAPLPDVALENLRYSRDPVQQGLWLVTGVSGSQNLYSNGFSQSYLVGKVGFQAVMGALLADSFDFTGLNVTYSNGLLTGSSPFLYDRITTREQLEMGILQQIYGPVQVGAETSLDLQTGRSVDTTYSIGFQRRTYGVTVRFSPTRQTGALELRIDDLNWNN